MAISFDEFSVRIEDQPEFQVPATTLNSGVFFIRGANGAGKTSLLKRLHKKFYQTEPNSSVLFSQDYRRLLYAHKPIWWNIALKDIVKKTASKDTYIHQAKTLLNKIKLDHIDINTYPSSLSGGESQLILFARFLTLDNHTLLMDEPFSAVDINRKFMALDLLKSVSVEKNTVAIVVTHDHPEKFHLKKINSFLGIDKQEITLEEYIGQKK